MRQLLSWLSASLFLTSFSLSSIAAKPSTLVYCSEGSPEGFTPAFFTSGTTLDASSRQLFNRLVQFELGKTSLIPGLAESWEISEYGLTYTFKLRKNVAFHSLKHYKPSRPFNADDVLFSFQRQMDSNHPYHKVSGGKYEYFSAMGMGSLIKSLKKIDDYTVEFQLNRPEAPFLANIAMDFASIMSAEYAENLLKKDKAETFDKQPVGTGPFKMVQYQKDAVIRYLAHEDYWAGKPQIDRLVFAITPDASVRYAKLKKGECHVMPYPNPADVAAMEKDPNINLLTQEGLNVGYLGYNTEKAPFDQIKVRQALNMAVDKKAILEAVFQGVGQIAKNPIPPTMWSYNNDINDDAYSPEKAKQLLSEAGFPSGFETTIWAMPVQRPYNPNARRMAELIQADWAKIGVKTKVVSYEWGEYLKRTASGEHDTLLMGWIGDNGDPDNFLYVLLSCDAVTDGANRARFCHKEFDELLKQAKQTKDIEKRTALYKKAQVIFKEQAPWLTIAHSVVFEPIRPEVQGYKIDPFGGHYFYNVSLKSK